MAAIIAIAVVLIGLVIFIGYLRSEEVEWKYIVLLLAVFAAGGVLLKARSDNEWKTYQRGYDQASQDVYEKYYEEGYGAGYEEGYTTGYNDGFEDGDK